MYYNCGLDDNIINFTLFPKLIYIIVKDVSNQDILIKITTLEEIEGMWQDNFITYIKEQKSIASHNILKN